MCYHPAKYQPNLTGGKISYKVGPVLFLLKNVNQLVLFIVQLCKQRYATNPPGGILHVFILIFHITLLLTITTELALEETIEKCLLLQSSTIYIFMMKKHKKQFLEVIQFRRNIRQKQFLYNVSALTP